MTLDDSTVVGDYDPEIEELVRRAKRENQYFNDPAALGDFRRERARRMRDDHIMARLTDADPAESTGSNVSKNSEDGFDQRHYRSVTCER